MSFQLDTSGRVVTELSEAFETYYEWSDLRPEAQVYIEALFAECGEDLDKAAHARIGWHPDDHVGYSELAPETLTRIIADCERLASCGWQDFNDAWDMIQKGVMPGMKPYTVQLGEDGKIRFV